MMRLSRFPGVDEDAILKVDDAAGDVLTDLVSAAFHCLSVSNCSTSALYCAGVIMAVGSTGAGGATGGAGGASLPAGVFSACGRVDACSWVRSFRA